MTATALPIGTRAAALRKALGTLLPDLIVNVGLPYVIYRWLAPQHGEVPALLAASAPPVIWGLGELALRRKVDALSCLSVAGIALSLLALFGGGGARWLQLREKLASGVVALALLGSCLTGTPLLLILVEAGAARGDGEKAERLRAAMAAPGFRRRMMLLTLVWGLGLLADVIVSAGLIFVLPIPTYLLVNPLLGYAVMGGLSLWTLWYARRHGLNGAACGSNPAM
jgi:hypothetical protein